MSGEIPLYFRRLGNSLKVGSKILGAKDQFGNAFAYFWKLCCPSSGLTGRGNLCFAFQGELVRFAPPSKMQRRAVSVVGPTTWNNLPSYVLVLLASDSAYNFTSI